MENTVEPVTKKRKKESCESFPKRLKLDDEVHILSLSDCILLKILKYSNATDLYQLSQTCSRFEYLVRDGSLWIHMDSRTAPNTFNKFEYCMKNIHDRTVHFMVSGQRRLELLVYPQLLTSLKNLTVIALEHQQITKEILLDRFPKTMQELSLRWSYVCNSDFFCRQHENVPNLRVLLLDHCQWLETAALMSISKYPKLEILSLYMCKKLQDMISYVSLAGRLGFCELKVADLRFTGLGDQFMRSFYHSQTLQEIYFQQYCATYGIEKARRKAEIAKGAEQYPESHLSDDEANNDTSLMSIKDRFAGDDDEFVEVNYNTLDGYSTNVYVNVQSTTGALKRPHSVLYNFPYKNCTCGYYTQTKEGGFGTSRKKKRRSDRGSSETTPDSSSNDSSDDDDDYRPAKKVHKKAYDCVPETSDSFVYYRRYDPQIYRRYYDVKGNKHSRLTEPIPKNILVEDNASCKSGKWLGLRYPKNDYELSMLEHSEIGGAPFGTIIDHIPFYLEKKKCQEKQRNVSGCSNDYAGPSTLGLRKDVSIDPQKTRESQLVLSGCSYKANNGHDEAGPSTSASSHTLVSHDNSMRNSRDIAGSDSESDNDETLREYPESSDCKAFFNDNVEEVEIGPGETVKIVPNSHVIIVDMNQLRNNANRYNPRPQNDDPPLYDDLKIQIVKSRHVAERPNDSEIIASNEQSNENNAVLDDERDEALRRLGLHIYAPSEHDDPVPKVPIKKLSLRGYKNVTDMTLDYIHHLDLDLLDITKTSISERAVQSYTRLHPECRVIHESTCKCRPRLHF